MVNEFNLSEEGWSVKAIRTDTHQIVYFQDSLKEFIKIIEKKVMDYRMYADMDEDDFWSTSTISPKEAEQKAKYCEELMEFIIKKAGKDLI